MRTAMLLFLALFTLNAQAEIYPDAEAAEPLQAGERAPAFTARHPDGSAYRFDPEQRERPALIIFYRGGWCPYCNMHLGALATVESEIRALGYEVLFLSADRPERIWARLDQDKRELGYTLLSDRGLEIAQAFGLAYRVSTEYQRKLLEQHGWDLVEETGLDEPALPVPAAYLVDTDGVIRFAYANPDYKVRVDVDRLLEIAEANAEH